MDPIAWVILALVIVAAIAVFAFLMWRRRSERLQERFGPEYERMVETGGRREAESELASRERRYRKLEIRPLDPAARDDFARQWRETQRWFVDQPTEAVARADVLVAEVMRQRGYPVEDFGQREADLSVDHAEVMENYRAAHGITMAAERRQATTEDLRQAMVHYRTLFDRLLATGDREPEVIVDVEERDDSRREIR